VNHGLIVPERFILAVRSSGYRGTSSAVAELVDNGVQAGASVIGVSVSKDPGREYPITVRVVDNGCGMSAPELREALRFGGTTRFNDRSGLGRFGMGLPNASLSQSRRLDVVTWKSRRAVYRAYLDADEIAAGDATELTAPTRIGFDTPGTVPVSWKSGTVVSWTRCDRLDFQRPSTLVRKMRIVLGRMFRHLIWGGLKLTINDEEIVPLDPLFLEDHSLTRGGTLFSKERFEVRTPGAREGAGSLDVTFSRLPVEEWHSLPSEQKRRMGVTGGAGVSVVRAGREIDYGWHFMGSKRKQNYDDWWRCEVMFQPDLDDLFGVTHTKQGINPTPELLSFLVPHTEAVARAGYLEVGKAFRAAAGTGARDSGGEGGRGWRVLANGSSPFFEPDAVDDKARPLINRDHPFATRAEVLAKAPRELLEALLSSAAVAEAEGSKADQQAIRRFRERWSTLLWQSLAGGGG
jgi:hypothetical protein